MRSGNRVYSFFTTEWAGDSLYDRAMFSKLPGAEGLLGLRFLGRTTLGNHSHIQQFKSVNQSSKMDFSVFLHGADHKGE